MPTILTKKSKELVTNLLNKDWNTIDWSVDFIYQRSDKLINLALELGMIDWAKEKLEEIELTT